MSLEADSIAVKRDLRRRLGVWRIVAVVAAVVAAVAVVAGGLPRSGLSARFDHVARIRIEGMITGDRQTLKMLDDLAASARARAVIVHVDSPGGTTAGSEAIYEKLRAIAGQRPVAAVAGTTAASGGYIVAAAADRIFVRGNTITGSIGVIFQWAEVKQLLDTLGVRMEEVKTGELKAEPSPFRPASEQARAATRLLVEDTFAWFKGLVGERRSLPAAAVDRLADGRVLTGRQAVAERLADEIGGEDAALRWLETERGLARGLTVVDWEPERDPAVSRLGLVMIDAVGRALGLGGAAKVLAPERLSLDGLMSLWHPEL